MLTRQFYQNPEPKTEDFMILCKQNSELVRLLHNSEKQIELLQSKIAKQDQLLEQQYHSIDELRIKNQQLLATISHYQIIKQQVTQQVDILKRRYRCISQNTFLKDKQNKCVNALSKSMKSEIQQLKDDKNQLLANIQTQKLKNEFYREEISRLREQLKESQIEMFNATPKYQNQSEKKFKNHKKNKNKAQSKHKNKNASCYISK